MKILVVDDHVLIREALRGLFKELRPEATVLEAPDAARTMELLAEQPDIALVLLDLSLPDRDGLALLEEVRGRHPGNPVVVPTAPTSCGRSTMAPWASSRSRPAAR
jgi:DNA-binding NarL/FixJ family response regulator